MAAETKGSHPDSGVVADLHQAGSGGPANTTGSAKDKDEAAMVHAENDESMHKGAIRSENAPMEALGIPDWQALEKKLVRRLDLTTMPMLWILYLFNYLDRSSIAYVVRI